MHRSSFSRLIRGLRPANERRRYKVTPSLIGSSQTWNEPDCVCNCNRYLTLSLPLVHIPPVDTSDGHCLPFVKHHNWALMQIGNVNLILDEIYTSAVQSWKPPTMDCRCFFFLFCFCFLLSCGWSIHNIVRNLLKESKQKKAPENTGTIWMLPIRSICHWHMEKVLWQGISVRDNKRKCSIYLWGHFCLGEYGNSWMLFIEYDTDIVLQWFPLRKCNSLWIIHVPVKWKIDVASQYLHCHPPEQSGCHFADNIFKYILWMKSFLFWLMLHTSLCLRVHWQSISIGSGNGLAPNRRPEPMFTDTSMRH